MPDSLIARRVLCRSRLTKNIQNTRSSYKFGVCSLSSRGQIAEGIPFICNFDVFRSFIARGWCRKPWGPCESEASGVKLTLKSWVVASSLVDNCSWSDNLALVCVLATSKPLYAYIPFTHIYIIYSMSPWEHVLAFTLVTKDETFHKLDLFLGEMVKGTSRLVNWSSV